ncbi:MAG TPA: methyltransferase [Chitinophagaceae bacterium]|jgi:release factor glutamine methyltransferase|nr:methyltransferase [Chitinophagaceae bacterium]
MQKIIGRLANTFYKPLLTKYLSKTRGYRYKDIRLRIPPEVFHPGFFFSTRLLINFIKRLEIENKTFLELGAGSGLISIYAAKRKAKVTATDINPVAVENLNINSLQNDVAIEIILSDMFKNIPKQDFDLVIINPPYYKRNAITFKDYAWYCGENGEYFQSLFKSLGDYMHNTSIVLMILSQNCDFGMIRSIAEKNQFRLDCTYKRKNIMEENYIYKIERSWVVNPDYSS